MSTFFRINPETEMIPDAGIGDFIEGYSQKGERVNYAILVLFLFPIPGLYFVIEEFLHYMKTRNIVNSYYLYSGGFIYQRRNGTTILDQDVIDFKKVKGISLSHTRLYGQFGMYNNTEVCLQVLNEEMSIVFNQTSSYVNKNEKTGKYNLCGQAFNAILYRWDKIALERFNHEFADKGYGTFISRNIYYPDEVDMIQVGENYIKQNNAYAETGNSKFLLNDGKLQVFTESGNGNDYDKAPLEIDINKMFNSNVFLIVIRQLLGVEI